MSQTTTEFLERLRQFIQEEASAQYKTMERQWSHPLPERVAKGWAIEGLKIEDFQKGIIRLSCQTNDSRFREGDLIVLHRGNPRDENALHCDLQYDGEMELEASLNDGNEYFLSAYPDGCVIDQDWFDSSPFYLAALDQAAHSQLGGSIVLPLLQGSLAPQIDYARYERAKSELNNTSFRAGQVRLSPHSEGDCFVGLSPLAMMKPFVFDIGHS